VLVDTRVVHSLRLEAVADYNFEQNSSGAQQEQCKLAARKLEVLHVPVKMLAAAADTDWKTDWSQKGLEAAPVHGSLGVEDTE
jgi:hypothetical protein